MKEKTIIVFIAVAAGLLITTIGFFIYQSTKILPKEEIKNTKLETTKVTDPSKRTDFFLTIDEPKDESIFDRRTIQVKGKTNPQNTLIVSSNQEDVVAVPTSEGLFSVSLSIDGGTNKIITRCISQTGEETKDERVVTFSTEEF